MWLTWHAWLNSVSDINVVMGYEHVAWEVNRMLESSLAGMIKAVIGTFDHTLRPFISE